MGTNTESRGKSDSSAVKCETFMDLVNMVNTVGNYSQTHSYSIPQDKFKPVELGEPFHSDSTA